MYWKYIVDKQTITINHIKLKGACWKDNQMLAKKNTQPQERTKQNELVPNFPFITLYNHKVYCMNLSIVTITTQTNI